MPRRTAPEPPDDPAAAEASFEDLAQEVCRKAAAIQCSPADYRDGLRHIIEELKTALDAAC